MTTARAWVVPRGRVISYPSNASAALGLFFVALPLCAYGAMLAANGKLAGAFVDVSVYAALAIALWRGVTIFRAPVVAEVLPARVRPLEVIAVAGIFAALTWAGYAGYLASNGIPTLRQDWAWPVDDAELHALYGFLTADWTLSAFGHPKGFPTLYTMFAPIAVLGHVLGTHAVLAVFFAACELAAGIGMFLVARVLLRAAATPALVGSLFCACAPYVVDKAVGGHTHVLLAYALLPWVALVQWRADRSRRELLPLWTVVLGALAALAMAALTFVAFYAVAMFVLALTLRHRRRALILIGGSLLTAAACHAQSLYHLSVGSGTGLDSGRSAIDWLRYLSADSASVLSLFAYIPGYATSALPAWVVPPVRDVLVPISIALLGWAVAYGGRRALAFGLIGLFGIIGATGIEGPFAPLKEFVYGHVYALAAFREFYNVEMLMLFGLAALIAAGLHALASAGQARYAGNAALVAVVAIATLPYLRDGISPQLHLWAEPASYAGLAARLIPGGGERIAMFPLVQPIRPGDAKYAGTDVFFSGFRGHPTLAEWRSEPAIALAAVLYHDGDVARANRLLGLLGVKWLVLRNGLTSALPSFWYPGLFPADWERNGYYRRLSADRSLDRIAQNADFQLLRNTLAVPIVSLAPPARACVGNALLADADGKCPRFSIDAASLEAHALQHVPLSPDSGSIDPWQAWTSPASIFALGGVFAAAAHGIATVGGVQHVLRFSARANTRLYLSCASRNGFRIYLNGRALGPSCRTGDLGPERWLDGFAVPAGRNVLVVVNGSGPSLLQDAILSSATRDAPPERFAAFAWAPPAPQGGRAGSLTFKRVSPTALDGSYASPSRATLVFSDAFDADWQLTLDGAQAALRAQRVNGVENGFDVPPGAHRFALRFVTAPLDRALGALQEATWFVFALVALATLLQEVRRRPAFGRSFGRGVEPLA